MAKSSKSTNDAKQELSFEESLAQLEAIIAEIEQGKIGLEDSIERYEQGMKLLRRCRQILAEAELRIQKLQEGSEGELTTEALGTRAALTDE